MNSILGSEYNSEVTADHGFEFQEELLLHVCLRLIEMDCQSFSVGLEVKEFPKFDDVVLEFELSGKKFLFFLQAKHVLNQAKVILPDHFFSPTESGVTVKTQRDLWKNFNLNQYIRSPMTEAFQERLQQAKDFLLRYIIVTNLVYVGDYEEEDCDEDNEAFQENNPDTVEDNEDFQELFLALKYGGAEIFKFGEKSNAKIQALIDHITTHEKKEKLMDLGLGYFRERIVVISRSPNLKKLTEINNKMLSKNYKVFNQESFRKILRKNLFEFTAIDADTRCRKTLEKEDFDRIASRTMVEVDFPTISETFRKEFPEWIKFTVPALESLQEQLKKISCDESGKLAIWKVYEALKMKNQDLLVIPHSKISEAHVKALKMYDRELILYLDDEENCPEEISDKKNIIFIGNRLEHKISFHLDEFTEESKEYFFRKEFKLQGSLVPYSSIPDTKDADYSTFISESLIRIANGESLCLGKDLPRDKIPPVYLERWPFTPEQFDEMFFTDVKNYALCSIIIGGPGMGKSCGLQNAAIYYKEKCPSFWVEFIDLKRYSKAFFDRGTSTFTEEEAVSFLMDRLVTYTSNNKEMEQRLLRIYLQRVQENSQLFVFFDGFDEISPIYEEIVLNLIKMLTKRYIKSFITSRVHCEGVLRELEQYSKTTIEPYKQHEMEEFLERYWKFRLPNISHPENIVKFRDQFFKYFGQFKAILETPILLRMLAEIVTRDCERYCGNIAEHNLMKFEKVDTWTIYGILFDMSFDGFYEKEGVDQTSNLAMSKKKQVMETIRHIHKYLAMKELNLMSIVPIEADVSKDVEILARGFITRTDDGQFFYVHRTYAEYFCAETLFDEVENYNVAVMQYLSRTTDTVISDFVYRLLIEKIKTKHIVIERDKIISADPKGLLLKHFAKFFDFFLRYVWQNSTSDVHDVANFIEDILYKPEIIQFDFDEYYAYLDKKYIFITVQQLLFIVEYTIRVFGRQNKSIILRQSDKFIKRKISGHDCEFLEEYYKSLVRQSILSEEEVIEEYFTALKRNVMSTWFRSELFFLYFKMKGVKYDEELNVFQKMLMENQKLEDFDTHYIFHLVLHEETHNKSSEFIKNLAVFLYQEDKMYQLLKFYDLDHKCRQDFVAKIVGAFSIKGLKFISKSNNSILYYFWKNDKNYLMKDFLNYLDPEDINELIQSPHFNGKSLREYVHSDENGDYINEAFITFVFRKLSEEQLFEHLSPCSESVNIQQTIRRDLNLCIALGNQIKSEESQKTNIMQNLIIRILNDKLVWKKITGRKICILHPVVSLDFKYESLHIPSLVYNILQERDSFLSEFKDVDEDGNTPLHLAGSCKNTEFFKQLSNLIEDNKTLIEVMRKENDKKQNFLHCFRRSDEMEDHKFFLDFKKFIEDRGDKLTICVESLLLKQDVSKKTPFHDQSELFFTKFIILVRGERFDELFSIEDDKKNTLFHTLTSNKSYGFGTIQRFVETNQTSFTALKESLLKTNDEGVSPLDLSMSRVNMFKYLTKFVSDVPK